MDSITMAEELAWLVKDNLPCKHLVLSVEEAFVTFLDPHHKPRLGNVLTLEPMEAYHRMLLHRLADIFRLGHESIGEGKDRHLVLERCEDSVIPDVLVSDILECNEDFQLSTSSQTAPHLLKRNTHSDAHACASVLSSRASYEERQAAYLAARERIFSEDLGPPQGRSSMSRPRSVPVVAQRMIAHALGKRIIAEQSSSKTVMSVSSGSTSDAEEPVAQGSRRGDNAANSSAEPSKAMEYSKAASTSASTGITMDSSLTLDAEEPQEPAESSCGGDHSSSGLTESSKAMEYSQRNAAKRMFANALGLGASQLASCRASSRPAEKRTSDRGCLQSANQGEIRKSYCAPRSSRTINAASATVCSQSLGQAELAKAAQLEQGKAAQRMFTQALRFQGLSLVAERPTST